MAAMVARNAAPFEPRNGLELRLASLAPGPRCALQESDYNTVEEVDRLVAALDGGAR